MSRTRPSAFVLATNRAIPSAERTTWARTIAIASGGSAAKASKTNGVSAISSRYPAWGEAPACVQAPASRSASPRVPVVRRDVKSPRAAIRAAGGQWVASSNVSAMRKRRYATVTSRRVGSGSGGIESANVRLVFSRSSRRSATGRMLPA